MSLSIYEQSDCARTGPRVRFADIGSHASLLQFFLYRRTSIQLIFLKPLTGEALPSLSVRKPPVPTLSKGCRFRNREPKRVKAPARHHAKALRRIRLIVGYLNHQTVEPLKLERRCPIRPFLVRVIGARRLRRFEMPLHVIPGERLCVRNAAPGFCNVMVVLHDCSPE